MTLNWPLPSACWVRAGLLRPQRPRERGELCCGRLLFLIFAGTFQAPVTDSCFRDVPDGRPSVCVLRPESIEHVLHHTRHHPDLNSCYLSVHSHGGVVWVVLSLTLTVMELTLRTRLASDSKKSACLCFWRAGIKGGHYQTLKVVRSCNLVEGLVLFPGQWVNWAFNHSAISML